MIRILDTNQARPVDDLVALCLDQQSRDEPRLSLNMVMSLDGATAVNGRSAPLSDDDDRALFMALRAASDVVVVGAGTVRQENYGPVKLDQVTVAQRIDRGLEPLPKRAVVSASLDLDPGARFFSDPDQRPYVVTGRAAPADRKSALADVAEVVVAGERLVDAHEMLGFFAGKGHNVVLCEGGPTLNSELMAADLVDEIHLTLSPQVTGGSLFSLVAPTSLSPVPFRLDRLMLGEKMAFLRYLREGR